MTRWRVVIGGAVIVVLAALALTAHHALRRATPTDPLAGSDQVVLVTARTERATQGSLSCWDRTPEGWRVTFSCPVVLGRSGVAWGRGLHGPADYPRGEREKREGDGCSPQGAYNLIESMGYLPPNAVRIAFPYRQITSDLICIDDIRREYRSVYNNLISAAEAGPDSASLPSHERMRRDDTLYKYLVVIGHNTPNPKPGYGSCIFLHLWADDRTPTAGCTALSEESMLSLLAWLDLSRSPRLIQLSRASYIRLADIWDLPEVIP